MAIRRAWSRFGALPALPFVVLFFVVTGVATLTTDQTTSTVVGVVLVALLLVYCVARPAGGTDLFLYVAAPNAGWQMAKDLFGAPYWVYLALLPIALIGAWNVDHPDEQDETVPPSSDHRDAEPPVARG